MQRAGRVELVGDRQQQRDGQRRADAGQHADGGAERHADQRVEQVRRLQRDERGRGRAARSVSMAASPQLDQPLERPGRQRELQDASANMSQTTKASTMPIRDRHARAARGRSRGAVAANSRPVAIEKPHRADQAASARPARRRSRASAPVGLLVARSGSSPRKARSRHGRSPSSDEQRRRSRRATPSARRGRTARRPASRRRPDDDRRQRQQRTAAMTSAAPIRGWRLGRALPRVARAHFTRPIVFRIVGCARRVLLRVLVELVAGEVGVVPALVAQHLLPGGRLHHLLDRRPIAAFCSSRDAGGAPPPCASSRCTTSTPCSLQRRRVDAREALRPRTRRERAACRP